MATQNQNPNPAPTRKPGQAPAPAQKQTTAPAQNASKPSTPAANGSGQADSPAKPPKRAKVRLVSPSVPGFWVRAFVDIIQKYGMPKGPDGQPLEVGKGPAFGLTPEERERRKTEKEAEKARLAAMSDEEKLAYATARREKRASERLSKRAAERARLVAEIKAEMIASGEYVPPAPKAS